MEGYISLILGPIVVAGFLYAIRRMATSTDDKFDSINERLSSHSARMRELDQRMRGGMTREEARLLIDDKLEVICALMRELKEDIKELRRDRS